MPTSTAAPVAVVGGGLAGMAAAARLAKMGHTVTLHEATERLGARWAPTLLTAADGSERWVDAAPGAVAFPAPWRDLFRKSGRPLEAELARSGHALVAAPPLSYRFADGSELELPSDRGEQHEALRRAFGEGPAGRWQQLLDSLGTVWQALRPLGLEEPYDRRAVTRDVAERLWSGRVLADLADGLDEPRLRALVRSTAYRQGTTPDRAPALTAVDLLVGRTFGRWQVVPLASRGPGVGDVGRTSVLVEALAARLALRGVEVRLGSRVTGVDARRGGVTAVRTAAGSESASAVVLALDPWGAAELAPARAAWRLRRALGGATPARLPVATHEVLDEEPGPVGSGDVSEVVLLDLDGVPIVQTLRRLGGREVLTEHDHRTTTPQPGSGVATDGFRGWRRRPGTSTALPGLVLAGAASPAGASASAVLQSGALAACAVAGRRD